MHYPLLLHQKTTIMASDIGDGPTIACSQSCRPRGSDNPSLWHNWVLLQVCEGRAQKRPRGQPRTFVTALGSTTTRELLEKSAFEAERV